MKDQTTITISDVNAGTFTVTNTTEAGITTITYIIPEDTTLTN